MACVHRDRERCITMLRNISHRAAKRASYHASAESKLDALCPPRAGPLFAEQVSSERPRQHMALARPFEARTAADGCCPSAWHGSGSPLCL